MERGGVVRTGSAQAGFVLVQISTLLPLLLIAIIAAAGTQFAIRKKLKAQSLCVNTAIQLQGDLSKTLTELMRLNPRATQLRLQRANADRAWYSALATGYAPAIAAARAVRTGVILAQMALKAQQQRLLATARLQRLEYHRRLQSAGKSLAKTPIQSQTFYARALAVEPVPSSNLTPDYVPVAQFSRSQQHQFSFDVELTPPLWRVTFVQKTLCSVSLKGKEGLWKPQMIAASASSKWL